MAHVSNPVLLPWQQAIMKARGKVFVVASGPLLMLQLHLLCGTTDARVGPYMVWGQVFLFSFFFTALPLSLILP
jgi:hypothetical protein